MTLRRRMGIVLATLIALMAVAAVALTLTIRSRGDRNADMRNYAVTVEGAARLRAAYVDMETSQRGFIITGEDQFLEPYRSAQDDVTTLIRDVSRRHPGDRALQQSLDDVRSAGQRWMQTAAEPEIAARRAQGRAVAEQMIRTGEGQLLFDELRAALDHLDATADQRFDQASAADLRLRREQIAILVATFALALVFLAGVVVVLRRWVERPLADISSAAHRVADGEIRKPIPITGPKDVRELATSVDEMRQRMVSEIDRADRARKAVEQSASIVLQLQAVLTSEPSYIPEGWTAAAGLEPAEGFVAGDCYDLVHVGPNVLAVLLLDIAGHGAPAALTALRCREIVRAALRSEPEPGEALAALGQLDDLDADLFVSGFVAVIDLQSGEVLWANAGHPPALLRHGAELIELAPTGPVVGPFDGQWRTERATIHPGGQLVVYTDGIPEARGADGLFGEDRLARAVASGPPKAAEMVAELLHRAKEHAASRLRDDATALVVGREDGRDEATESAP